MCGGSIGPLIYGTLATCCECANGVSGEREFAAQICRVLLIRLSLCEGESKQLGTGEGKQVGQCNLAM